MSFRRPIHPDSTSRFYKKEAKKLLRQYRDNNPLALELFDHFHPQKTSQKEIKLSDAQLVIAKHHGQKSWIRLLEMVASNKASFCYRRHFKGRFLIGTRSKSKSPVFFKKAT